MGNGAIVGLAGGLVSAAQGSDEHWRRTAVVPRGPWQRGAIAGATARRAGGRARPEVAVGSGGGLPTVVSTAGRPRGAWRWRRAEAVGGVARQKNNGNGDFVGVTASFDFIQQIRWSGGWCGSKNRCLFEFAGEEGV